MRKIIEVEFIVTEGAFSNEYIESHVKETINFSDNTGVARTVKVTDKTAEEYKELAYIAAYIIDNDLLEGTIMQTFDEAYDVVAKELLKEYPVDYVWGVREEYDETIEKFVKERYINGKRRSNYSIGDRFKSEWSGDEIILASVGTNLAQLIHLENGHRVSESILVKDSSNITDEEFSRIEGAERFVKI